MDIQTRPIPDLLEMSKDSQTAQLMVYDEADQTPKRMPRSVMPVFVNFAINIISMDDHTASVSATHSPSEVKELLLAKIPVMFCANISFEEYISLLIGTGACELQRDDGIDIQKGIMLVFQAIDVDAIPVHAVDGSNTWEIGPLPQEPST